MYELWMTEIRRCAPQRKVLGIVSLKTCKQRINLTINKRFWASLLIKKFENLIKTNNTYFCIQFYIKKKKIIKIC